MSARMMYWLRHLSSSLRIVGTGSPAAGLSRSLAYQTHCHSQSREYEDEEQHISSSFFPSPPSSPSSFSTGPMHPPPSTPLRMGETNPPRPPHFIDVSPLAGNIRQKVRDYTSQLLAESTKPIQLVGILANVKAATDRDDDDDENPMTKTRTTKGNALDIEDDSELYSERIAKSCAEDGIGYEVWRCPAATFSPKYIQDMIRHANASPRVDGILVFYPIFTDTLHKGPYKNKLQGVYYKTHDCHLRDLVAQEKDVEGLRGTKWYHNQRRLRVHPGQAAPQQKLIYPCTARSVEAILEHCHAAADAAVDWNKDATVTASSSSCWHGQTVSIVNRSEIVGRPLAAMLASKGATVYSIDETSTVLKFWPRGERLQRYHNMSLQECLAESAILVTGVPHENFQIPISYISHNATVVNVSEFPNVDEDELMNRKDITYIPQVGKVTVAILEENLTQLHRLRNQG